MYTMVWFRPVEGLRGLTHLSLIALHAGMMATAHLPSEGPLWDAFRRHPVFSVMQAGGTQVDLCFMLSGFLLCHRLLTAATVPSLAGFVGRRVVRLWPAMLLAIAAGLALGDDWSEGYNDGQPIIWRIGGALLFVNNYLDVSGWGSFTLSLCWSNSVELHCSVLLLLLVGALRGGGGSASDVARSLRWVLGAAVAGAVAIRASLFEKSTLNIFLLGQHSHFGKLQTDSSYRFLAERYAHRWRSSNSAAHIGHAYMNGMYNPTHTRFGPYAAGALLACTLILTPPGPRPASRLGAMLPMLLTATALANLAVPCIPPEDEVPLAAQHFATSALRLLAAASAALLLFRALVPPEHSWASRVTRALLSSRALALVGSLSYPSYMIHFRLLEYLNFSGAPPPSARTARPQTYCSENRPATFLLPCNYIANWH